MRLRQLELALLAFAATLPGCASAPAPGFAGPQGPPFAGSRGPAASGVDSGAGESGAEVAGSRAGLPSADELLDQDPGLRGLPRRRGLWPRYELWEGASVPDPRYPIHKALGLHYEPSYYTTKDALILIHPDGRRPTVIPIDPERGVAPRPEVDPGEVQRRLRRAIERDLEGLPPPLPPRIDS